MEQNRFKNTITRAALTLTLVLNFGEENTTGIVDAEANWLSPSGRRAKPSSFFIHHSSFSEAWYTLDGRKLDKQPTKPGLYIHVGRKVVVK